MTNEMWDEYTDKILKEIRSMSKEELANDIETVTGKKLKLADTNEKDKGSSYNRMKTDIAESINQLKTNINENQNQIDMLTRFFEIANEPMTEKQFHEYCKTKMRYTNTLGQSLMEVFPFLIYYKRDTNAFYYRFDDYGLDIPKDVQVSVPNNACNGIDFRVDRVYRSLEFEEEDIYKYHDIKLRVDYFNAKTIREKSQIIYPRCHNTFINITRYLVKNTYKHYDKELHKQLNRYIANATENQEIAKAEWKQHQKLYSEQQAFFETYFPLFLKWTNEVRVYSERWNSPIFIYKMLDGKLVAVKANSK